MNQQKTWTELLGPITPADFVLGKEIIRNEGNDQYQVLWTFPDATAAFESFKVWQMGY